MGDIKLLLNPTDDVRRIPSYHDNSDSDMLGSEWSVINRKPAVKDASQQLPSPSSTDFPMSPHTRKRPKLIKDAAVFTRGAVRGECRYPPDEFRDELLSAQHQQFEIFPFGNVASFPRHIPYNSEKKTFLGKTGRECFEVFHYNFKIPGEEKVHCMMWDYNIGLVRITPLFKCTGYSKTTPAKMLKRNLGLREICHSITGGALVAQGYWMPFDAAKAIAATFCWNIRYALTPVFGRDFPSICTSPDSKNFGDMRIDAAITRRCTEQARAYRMLEAQISLDQSVLPTPSTPDTPTHPHGTLLRGRLPGLRLTERECSSDATSDDAYSLSSATPSVHFRNVWTPSYTPRSVPPADLQLPSPHGGLARITGAGRKRIRATTPDSDLSSPPLSPKSHRRDIRFEDDFASSSESDSERVRTGARMAMGSTLPSDEKAAFLLMSLRLQKPGPRMTAKSIKRRASA